MSTEFPGNELADVIASALLGLDDDESVNVVVHLPSGQQLAVERVWYEPMTARVVLELAGNPTLRRDWDVLGDYAQNELTRWHRTRTVNQARVRPTTAHPLRDVRFNDEVITEDE